MTHVLKESVSPPDADVWRMWCGHECLALDDGTLVPAETNFYLEREAHLAECIPCLKAILSRQGLGLTVKVHG